MPVIYPRTIPDPEYVLIPEGEYEVEVAEVKEKTTKDGDEMWSVKFKITAGEFSGKKIFTNLVFSDGGLGNIKKFLKSAGFDMNTERVDLRSESIEGATLRATVMHEDYQGRAQSKIPYAGFSALDQTVMPPKPKTPDSSPAPVDTRDHGDSQIPF